MHDEFIYVKSLYGNTTKPSEDVWADLSAEADCNGKLKFEKLCKVVQLVMTLPHSNASEERVFSLIRKNKTEYRGSLQAGRMLSSLVCCKMNYFTDEKCHQLKHSSDVLKKAKQVTKNYNQQHSGTDDK